MELNLDWGMVYDEEMRLRLIQLLNNEYKDGELESLVNRDFKFIDTDNLFEQSAMYEIQIINSTEFLRVKDSLNRHRNITEPLYQNYDVFRYFKYDTLNIFLNTVDSLKNHTRKELTNLYLQRYLDKGELAYLVNICGHINDKRFIEPLKKALTKPNIFNIDAVFIALVLMGEEPYYSGRLKELTYSLEDIKKQDFVPGLEVYAELHSQESFFELSKYLHSNAYTDYTSEGPTGKAYIEAYRLIAQYIENEELQQILNEQLFNINIKNDRLKIYNWMQRNYGKYKMKRIW